jgi:hypothetical protein
MSACGLQPQAAANASIILIDELEHRLEPTASTLAIG